jgi:peptidoglycan hydrolase CwlO-like protein
MDKEQLIISLTSIIIMFIPIGTLIGKFSKLVFEVENNKKNIEAVTEKLNSRVDKIDERFMENEAKLSNIEVTMGRLEEKMNLVLAKITHTT